MNVHAGIGAVGERPENGVGVGGIDVVAHGNADLAAVRAQRRRALKTAPYFRSRRSARELQEDDFTEIGEWLVHRDAA